MFGAKKGGAPKPSETAILGNFNLNAQLPNGRSIQLAGYIYDGEDADSLNERLDLMQDAIERQRARCEVPELEAKREQRIEALENYLSALSDFENKQKRGLPINSQEKMMLQNKITNVHKMQEDIKKGEEAIEDARRRGGLMRKQAGGRA